jgi:malate synthase
VDVRGETRSAGVDDVADNQRNLKLAIIGTDFPQDARRRRRDESVGAVLGRPIDANWRKQLDFTTKIFPRGAHLDDRHVRVAAARLLRVDRRRHQLSSTTTTASAAGRRWCSYLPKIQTAAEAALWNDILRALERHLALPAARSRSTCSSSRSRRASS